MLKVFLVLGIFLSVLGRPPARIAFGSCNRFYESHKMDIFYKIVAQKPSHMFFLGDFVYLDKFIYPNLPTHWYSEEDESEILRKFNLVLNSAEFKAFAANNITVQIIWDDHDYNLNNGGTSNPMRFKMLEIFKSLFGTVTLFEDSLHKLVRIDENILVILLDVRSYKTSEEMFHEETWVWLENIFRNTSKDDLILIGSGIQVIYDDRIMMEKWHLSSRIRLYQLLQKYQIHSLIMSGDIHFAQMGYRDGLHEITSSGLSFSVADHLFFIEDIIDNFIPNTYSNKSQRFTGRNFAVIDVNYFQNETIQNIHAQIRDKNGDLVLQRVIPFEDTVVRNINWEDIKVDHKHIFEKNMREKLIENPLRVLVYIPFLYPLVFFVFAFIELLHWKID